MELTPEGEKILAHARTTIEASTRLLELTREIRDGAETTVRIGAPSLTALRQERKALFAAMAAQLPTITFDFVGMSIPDQLDALRRWQVDAVFYIAHTLDEIPEFEHLVIQHKTVDLLVDAASPLAREKSIPLQALRDMPIAVFARAHSPGLFDRITEVLGNRAGARLIVPAESHPFAIAVHAAEHQIAAVHSEWFHHGDMLPPGIVQRRIDGDPIVAEMSLVRLRDRPHKRGVEMFWRAAEKYLADPLKLNTPQK